MILFIIMKTIATRHMQFLHLVNTKNINKKNNILSHFNLADN